MLFKLSQGEMKTLLWAGAIVRMIGDTDLQNMTFYQKAQEKFLKDYSNEFQHTFNSLEEVAEFELVHFIKTRGITKEDEK